MKNKQNKFYNFVKNENAKEGTLYIYGEITSYAWGDEDTSASSFKKDLDGLGDINTLNIYINSPGGSVFEGQAIYSMLKRHKARKKVFVDGIAASIASVIAMAGDEIFVPHNAMIMIHNALTFAYGNSQHFRKIADDLEKINMSIIEVYKERTNLEEEKIKELMDNETWMTGRECVDMGFADEIIEENKVVACVGDGLFNINNCTMDFSKFKNVPKILANSMQNNLHDNKNNNSTTKQKLKLQLELL